ncbi:DnaJ domain-containing protein [Paenibacillaceae bacterium WGS1546]|uniref:J domain-containing protein n=1 Tax=Cohnella sp. WGS1546 TaxID=3366810 RepID=UPI00372D1E2B
MATARTGKRKKQQADVENHYKILGVRTNATQDSIKKKYIEKVREFPPETHPEQFQQIRRAYEILKNPTKRKEYDLQRKYGSNLENVLEEASDWAEKGNWKKAAEVYANVIAIDPGSISGLLGIAHAALHTDTERTYEEYFDLAFNNASSEEEKGLIRIYQARMLSSHGKPSDALLVLERIEEHFEELKEMILELKGEVYTKLGREEDALELVASQIPSLQDQKPSDGSLFIAWIRMLINTRKWNLLSSVQLRTRKFLKSLTDEEDRQTMLYELMSEHEGYWEAGRFREALIFVELAHFLDSKDAIIKAELRSTKENARREAEIERMMKDTELFPLVVMYAHEWFYGEHLDEDVLMSYRYSIPPELMERLEEDFEGLARGIGRLKQKYNLIYQYYRKDWDELLQDHAGYPGLKSGIRAR